VNSVSDRILAELHSIHGSPAASNPSSAQPDHGIDGDMDRLMDRLSDADLQALLAELEAPAAEGTGGGHS
jgi:hypothetical protein